MAFSKARRLANVMTTGAGIPTASIQNDAITSDKIDDDAVIAAAIADNAVDIARLNVSDGSNGQFLKTNGSGTMSFASITADSGRAYTDWSIKDSGSSYTAVSKDQLVINSGSAFTVTLPAASVSGGNQGNTVIICNAGAGAVTVGRNSSNINSAAEDGTLAQGASAQLVYVDDTIGWFEI